MKFPLSWLKQYLDTSASVEELAAKLNGIGLEVEGIENPAEKLAGFRIAKVLTADKHPQADKLQVLTVDAGDGVAQQVVCGAPNARAGLVAELLHFCCTDCHSESRTKKNAGPPCTKGRRR